MLFRIPAGNQNIRDKYKWDSLQDGAHKPMICLACVLKLKQYAQELSQTKSSKLFNIAHCAGIWWNLHIWSTFVKMVAPANPAAKSWMCWMGYQSGLEKGSPANNSRRAATCFGTIWSGEAHWLCERWMMPSHWRWLLPPEVDINSLY